MRNNSAATLPSDGPKPPYLMAADRLRLEIRAGRYKPGDRLPSSRELRGSLGIANATVRAALRVLRQEGLVYSVQGRGTYVADPAMPPDGAHSPAATLALVMEVRDEVRRIGDVVTDLRARAEVPGVLGPRQGKYWDLVSALRVGGVSGTHVPAPPGRCPVDVGFPAIGGRKCRILV